MVKTTTDTKIVTVGGKQFVVPVGFDPSLAENQQQLEAAIMSSLEQQIQQAEKVPETLEQAQGLALRDTRRSAARTLQQQRGLVGGGRGLGLARDVGLATESKVGALRGQFATDISTARQEAAAIKTQALIEQGKLLQLASERKAAASKAQQRVQEIQDEFKGYIYTTKADRQLMIDKLKLERDAAANPEAAEVYNTAIRKLQGTGVDLPGTLDIDF